MSFCYKKRQYYGLEQTVERHYRIFYKQCLGNHRIFCHAGFRADTDKDSVRCRKTHFCTHKNGKNCAAICACDNKIFVVPRADTLFAECSRGGNFRHNHRCQRNFAGCGHGFAKQHRQPRQRHNYCVGTYVQKGRLHNSRRQGRKHSGHQLFVCNFDDHRQ